MTDHTIAQLAKDWREAKTAENTSRDFRLETEGKIIDLVGMKAEGSQTHDAGTYKVTVTSSMTRKLDEKKWKDIEDSIPEDLRPVNYKPSIDLKGIRYLQENYPETYAIVTKALTVKPAKPSVKVEDK